MNENRYMNRTLITIVLILLLALLCYGTYDYCKPIEIEETIPVEEKEIWIPTVEDIAYQDSMYNIIQQTSLEVDTIKDQMNIIIDKLDVIQQEHSDDHVNNKEDMDWTGSNQGN